MVPRKASSDEPRSSQWLAPPAPPQQEQRDSSPKSILRSTHSNEADDERSSFSEASSVVMPQDARHGQPSYEGEDTRPTTRRELAGFYMYGWAVEVLRNAASHSVFRDSDLFSRCSWCAEWVL
ncbi:MAG: hypothetical protein INR71_03305 [Terriglobus roseus]|nr:hypothetical protein [Terriglobus roseus]